MSLKDKHDSFFENDNFDEEFGKISTKPKIRLKLENPKIKQDKCKSDNIVKRNLNTMYRSAYSEVQLLNLCEKIEMGYIYNYLTLGDINTMSYLKLITRQHDLDYLSLSTWAMGTEDVYSIRDMFEEKKIKKMDMFVDYRFLGVRKQQYRLLCDLFEKYEGSITTLQNHSKTMAGKGDGFYFAIQSSANMNENPRVENTCIQTTKEIFDFYYDFFKVIKDSKNK